MSSVQPSALLGFAPQQSLDNPSHRYPGAEVSKIPLFERHDSAFLNDGQGLDAQSFEQGLCDIECIAVAQHSESVGPTT
jgi:hypothetical protein